MNIRVSDVFAEASPTHTLVDRSSTREFRRIQKELRSGGKIVRLHGPSKSGKTLLCRQVYAGTDPIVVYGSDIETRDGFWKHVGAAVALDPHQAPLYCAEQKRPIVIDDFHWIDRNVQAAILRSFKPFLDHGGTAILLSVPDVAQVFLDQARATSRMDPIPGDLLGKSVPVEPPTWEETELRQIATKGFPVLNLNIPSGVIGILIRFSFRNPLLMQKHCSELCFELGVDSALDIPTNTNVSRANLIEAFRRVASINGNFFDQIVRNGGKRPFALGTGKHVSLPELVLYAITRVNVNQKVGGARIIKNIRELITDESPMPDRDAIHKAFDELISSMRKSGQSGLVMDGNGYLYIAHPFFKSYLVWLLAPYCGSSMPDLDHYSEPDERE